MKWWKRYLKEELEQTASKEALETSLKSLAETEALDVRVSVVTDRIGSRIPRNHFADGLNATYGVPQ